MSAYQKVNSSARLLVAQSEIQHLLSLLSDSSDGGATSSIAEISSSMSPSIHKLIQSCFTAFTPETVSKAETAGSHPVGDLIRCLLLPYSSASNASVSSKYSYFEWLLFVTFVFFLVSSFFSLFLFILYVLDVGVRARILISLLDN